MRLGACLGVGIDIIEPCGFIWDIRRIRRAGMDYMDMVDTVRHSSWASYLGERQPGRLLLLTTAGEASHLDFAFRQDDALLLGRESAGVPPEVHDVATDRLRVPMRAGVRSLNVAMTAALVMGEALRQTGGFPADETVANITAQP